MTFLEVSAFAKRPLQRFIAYYSSKLSLEARQGKVKWIRKGAWVNGVLTLVPVAEVTALGSASWLNVQN